MRRSPWTPPWTGGQPPRGDASGSSPPLPDGGMHRSDRPVSRVGVLLGIVVAGLRAAPVDRPHPPRTSRARAAYSSVAGDPGRGWHGQGASMRPASMRRATQRQSFAVSVVLGVLVGVLAGCSSGGSDTTSAATTTTDEATSAPAVCTSTDDLQASMAGLADVQVVQDGTAALQASLATVKTDLQRVVDDARSEFSSQVDQLQSSFDAVQ